jgi:RNA 2',3'-cyclic 3'-phosphodiesterase
VRLFFALWPPPEAARALGEWAGGLERATAGKPTAVEKIHLTLAFLGEAEPAKALAAGRRVGGRAFDFPVDLARYWRENHIVWAGPKTMPTELAVLVRELHAALAEHGFVLEPRPFRAPVTLLRKARAPRALAALPRIEWRVTEFLLVRSALSPKGSAYEPIERFALRA